tara:strand:- start:1865 stop:2149 length:285 start_codon:yes stop_codon:yes gene_type:complete
MLLTVKIYNREGFNDFRSETKESYSDYEIWLDDLLIREFTGFNPYAVVLKDKVRLQKEVLAYTQKLKLVLKTTAIIKKFNLVVQNSWVEQEGTL